MGVTLGHPEFGTERSLRRIQGALDMLDAGVAAGTIRNADREEAKATLSSAYSSEENELHKLMPHREVLEAEGLDMWGKAAGQLYDLLPYGMANVRVIPKRIAAARKEGVPPSAEAYLVRIEAFAERWSQAQDLVVATKDIAVKGRKVLDASERKTKVRTIDHTGSCGCCGQNVKLTDSDKAVAHGFQLRWSTRQGSCPGVDLLPIEVSPEGVVVMIDIVGRQVERREGRLERLRTGTPKIAKAARRAEGEVVWVEAGDPDYPRLRREHEEQVAYELRHLLRDREKMRATLDVWEPTPLPDGRRDHLDATPAPSP